MRTVFLLAWTTAIAAAPAGDQRALWSASVVDGSTYDLLDPHLYDDPSALPAMPPSPPPPANPPQHPMQEWVEEVIVPNVQAAVMDALYNQSCIAYLEPLISGTLIQSCVAGLQANLYNLTDCDEDCHEAADNIAKLGSPKCSLWSSIEQLAPVYELADSIDQACDFAAQVEDVEAAIETLESFIVTVAADPEGWLYNTSLAYAEDVIAPVVVAATTQLKANITSTVEGAVAAIGERLQEALPNAADYIMDTLIYPTLESAATEAETAADALVETVEQDAPLGGAALGF